MSASAVHELNISRGTLVVIVTDLAMRTALYKCILCERAMTSATDLRFHVIDHHGLFRGQLEDIESGF